MVGRWREIIQRVVSSSEQPAEKSTLEKVDSEDGGGGPDDFSCLGKSDDCIRETADEFFFDLSFIVVVGREVLFAAPEVLHPISIDIFISLWLTLNPSRSQTYLCKYHINIRSSLWAPASLVTRSQSSPSVRLSCCSKGLLSSGGAPCPWKKGAGSPHRLWAGWMKG